MSKTAIPKQVQQQEDEANQLVESLQNPPASGEGEGTPPAPDSQGSPPAQDIQNPPPASDTPPTQEEEEAELYRRRYESLRGMYESQIPQYQEQIKFLQSLLSQTQAGGVPEDGDPGQPTRSVFGDVQINEEELKDYGTDFFDVVGRQAKLATQEGFNTLLSRFEQLEDTISQLSNGQAAVVQNTFESELERLVPKWREIDTDPRFIEWLNGADEFTGQRKFDLLRSAVSAGDARRAAVFFNTWANGNAGSQEGPPPPNPQQSAASQGLAAATTPSVAQQPSDAAAAQVASTGRTYTQADIQKFYADIRKGLYNGKEAEVQAIEADIQKAMTDGRLLV